MAGCLQNINDLWILPLQVIIAFILLYFHIRLAFLAGVAVIIVLIPSNAYIAQQISINTTALMKEKDSRLRCLLTALTAFTSMKACGLEHFVAVTADQCRMKELRYLAKRKYLDALCVFLWAFTPILVPFATFTVAKCSHQELSPSTIIVTLALLNTLIFPMNAFPWVINGFMEARVSLRRLGKLVNAEDNTSLSLPLGFEQKVNDEAIVLVQETKHLTTLSTQHTFPAHRYSWTRSDTHTIGLASDLQCIPGQMVAFTGLTGCGKTSLLLGLLQELHVLDERASLASTATANAIQLTRLRPLTSGSVTYCEQTPSLFSGSIRANILMGAEYEERRYQLILRGCGLDKDMLVC